MLLEQALCQFGSDPDIACQLALVKHADARSIDALAVLKSAIVDFPISIPLHVASGCIHADVGEHHAAILDFRAALAIDAYDVPARFCLANILIQNGRANEAYRYLKDLSVNDPNCGDVRTLLGMMYLAMRDLPSAESALREEVEVNPENSIAWSMLGKTLLQQQRFEEGWEAWQRYCRGKAYWYWPTPLHAPIWDGSPFEGTLIVDLAGDGLGDCVQFSRFLGRAAQLCSRLICISPSPLIEILRWSFPAIELLPATDLPNTGDQYVFIRVLPCFFVHTLSDICGAPYLFPPRKTFALDKRRPAVGICWSSAHRASAPAKCIPTGALRKLLSNLDANFICLQYGIEAGLRDEAAELQIDFSCIDASLTHIAGVMAGLDLVVSVDTVYAHLGGAMGVPTWLLLHKGSDWRWFDGSRTPWYDSVRIFRQAEEGSWDDVLSAVAEEAKLFFWREEADKRTTETDP